MLVPMLVPIMLLVHMFQPRTRVNVMECLQAAAHADYNTHQKRVGRDNSGKKRRSNDDDADTNI